MTTRYRKVGDSYVPLASRWITNGDVANWYTVFAREEGTVGHKGIACFVVKADQPGVSGMVWFTRWGKKASHTCDIIFEEVEVPASRMLAGPDKGFSWR